MQRIIDILHSGGYSPHESECTGCRSCERNCPRHIRVSELLRRGPAAPA